MFSWLSGKSSIIARRLQAIIDSDKVFVLDKGNLVESDHPYKLLSKYFGSAELFFKDLGNDFAEVTVNSLIFQANEGENTTSCNSRKLVDFKEFKSPPAATFASLVLETGNNMAIRLWKASWDSWKSK